MRVLEPRVTKRQRAAGPPRVIKGGDGGAAPTPETYAQAFENENRRTTLTGADIGRGLPKAEARAAREAFEAGLVETADPTDCSHADRQTTGRYQPQTGRRGELRPGLAGKPRRRYPGALMVPTIGGLVSIDSAFDAAWACEQRLRAMGIELVKRPRSITGERERVVREIAARCGDDPDALRSMVRSMLQPRTRQAMTAVEMQLEREASELLRAGRERRTEHRRQEQ